MRILIINNITFNFKVPVQHHEWWRTNTLLTVGVRRVLKYVQHLQHLWPSDCNDSWPVLSGEMQNRNKRNSVQDLHTVYGLQFSGSRACIESPASRSSIHNPSKVLNPIWVKQTHYTLERTNQRAASPQNGHSSGRRKKTTFNSEWKWMEPVLKYSNPRVLRGSGVTDLVTRRFFFRPKLIVLGRKSQQ